jgi:hypothetical protein
MIGRLGSAALAGGSAIAGAVPLLFIPTNSQPDVYSLGDGLRARWFGDSREVVIERRVDKGFFGSGIGAKWENTGVRATMGRSEDGHLQILADPEELERAIGKDAAARVVAQPGAGLPPQLPPPPVPWMVELRVAGSTDRAKTIVHNDLTQAEVEKVCPNYPNVNQWAMEASGRAQASGLKNGLKYGRFVHDEFRSDAEKISQMTDILKEHGIQEMRPEQALFQGSYMTYNPKGSHRVDLMETYPDSKTVCVYEVKTGNAPLTKEKMEDYATQAVEAAGKGYTRVFVVLVRVP